MAFVANPGVEFEFFIGLFFNLYVKDKSEQYGLF